MPLSQPTREASAPAPTHVYAVHSRRTGGLSIGVDVTPNHACSFRCVYCDVPDLVDRDGSELDTAQLEAELREAFEAVSDAGWRERAGVGEAPLASLCLSGRGEPTKQFDLPAAAEVIAKVARDRVPRFAILTNGIEISGKRSRAALATWADLGGEIWFKLDSATRDGQRNINQVDILLRSMRNALRVAAETCPTWLQTTLFTRNGEPSHDEAERKALVSFVSDQVRSGLPLKGIQLVSANRASAQPEGSDVGPATADQLAQLAAEFADLGIEVAVCGAD